MAVEDPSVARIDERHEWEYGQQQHQAALRNARSTIDQSVPTCVDPAVQRVQAQTRRFHEDLKRAEIGRENRKLVEKLTSISRGYGRVRDPRAPPPMEPGRSKMSTSSLQPSASTEKMRVKQWAIDQENASLVRRIISVKSCFDRKADSRDFEKHGRAVYNLQRYTDPRQVPPPQPRSLPPIRPIRPSSFSGQLQGLEGLFLPGDLRRAGSESFLASSGSGMHALTAPPAQLREASADIVEASAEIRPHEAAESSKEIPLIAVKDTTNSGLLAPPGQAASSEEVSSPELASTFKRNDTATERRSWLSPETQAASTVEESQAPGETRRTGLAMFKGISQSSLDVPYAENWDDNSMSETSPMRSRTSFSGTRDGDKAASSLNFGLSSAGNASSIRLGRRKEAGL